MEDVLELYEEEYDPKRPVVCFDEMPVQLIGETRVPQPPAPGRRARYDYEYRRNGTANLFIGFEPKAARRYVDATQRRTKVDFADQMKRLADERYPEAVKVRVVLDNLNTHRPASLYEAYEPGGGAAHLEEAGVPLHPPPRELAQPGGDRVGGALGAVPRPAHPRQGDVEVGDRGVGDRAQR